MPRRYGALAGANRGLKETTHKFQLLRSSNMRLTCSSRLKLHARALSPLSRSNIQLPRRLA